MPDPGRRDHEVLLETSGTALADPPAVATRPVGARHFRPSTHRPGAGLALGAEVVIAAALGLAVLAVHDVGYLLSQPYWLDEAWVADSIRAPLHLTHFLTSSSPIGWTLLLRLAPGAASTQRARLVPLIFAGLAAVAGYLLGRELKLQRHLSGLLVGAAVLLSPAMLSRNDLKQYTAEGCASVAVMLLVARAENNWQRRRVAALGLLVFLGMFFAATIVFTGAVAFAGLVLETAVSRQWRRSLETAAIAVVAYVGCGIEYLVFVKPNVIPSLTAYWDSYYLHRAGFFTQIGRRLQALAPDTAFKNEWLDLALVVVGLAVMVWMRRPALALLLPGVVVVNIVAAAVKDYPFGDARTSTYWLVLVPVVMAVAAAWVVDLLVRQREATAKVVAVVLTAGVVCAWVVSVDPLIRSHQIPTQDVRGAIEYVQAHRAPNDVVVVSLEASYAVAFYDTSLSTSYAHDSSQANGFLPDFGRDGWVVQVQGRDGADDQAALARATTIIDRQPAGSRGRIWIVLAELTSSENEFWQKAATRPGFQTVLAGSAPLLLYRPSS